MQRITSNHRGYTLKPEKQANCLGITDFFISPSIFTAYVAGQSNLIQNVSYINIPKATAYAYQKVQGFLA